MRTEQLEYVNAVARLGSFRRAAEELHISQPALSETVRNLERELGVDIFQRGRSGARLSADGRDLLAHISGVIEAVDGLRRAADAHHEVSRVVRLATVNAGTVPVLAPAIAAFRARHPDTQVEVVGAQQRDIDRGLHEGSLDLGLITALAGDDMPPALESTVLVQGHVIACVRAGGSLAALDTVSVEDLVGEGLIVMRAGYLMHRYLHRLLGDRRPRVALSTDGAEMGKLMVAEGLGGTLLPDFSVIDDPLERARAITWRPLRDAGDTEVRLVLRRRRGVERGRMQQEMFRILVERGHDYAAAGAASR